MEFDEPNPDDPPPSPPANSPPPPHLASPEQPATPVFQPQIGIDWNQPLPPIIIATNKLNWYQPLEMIGSTPSCSAVYEARYYAFGGFDVTIVALTRINSQPHLYLKSVGQMNKNKCIYHPLMVALKDEVLSSDQELWAVFEYVGPSIRSFFPNGCRLSVVAYCVAATLKVLVAIHQKGFVHGSITAGHLYFFEGHPRTVKIGFAGTIYDDTEGYPNVHSSPEVFYHNARYDVNSDIWMTGILCELFFGNIRVDTRQELELLIESVITEDNDYNNDFKNFLGRCLDENPVRPSAQVLLGDVFITNNLPGKH